MSTLHNAPPPPPNVRTAPRRVARRVPAGRRADPRAARDGAEHHRLRRRQRRPDRRPHPRPAERHPPRPRRQRRRHPSRVRLGVPQPRHGGERAHGLPDLGRLHRLRAARRPHLRRERRRADDGHGRPDVLEQRRGLEPDRRCLYPVYRHVPGQRPHDLLPVRQPDQKRGGAVRRRQRLHRERRGRTRQRSGEWLRQHSGRPRPYRIVDRQGVHHGTGVRQQQLCGRAGGLQQRHRHQGQLVDGYGLRSTTAAEPRAG